MLSKAVMHGMMTNYVTSCSGMSVDALGCSGMSVDAVGFNGMITKHVFRCCYAQ